MRNSKKILSKGKPSIAVVMDGQNESWCVAMIARNEPDIRFRIKPEIPQNKSLAEQYAKVISLAADYDEVIWIVDFDVILKETGEGKPGQPKAIDVFMRLKSKLESEHDNVTIIINQPCIEFWLLIHFEYTQAPFEDCAGAEGRLKRYLGEYSKTQRYYTKEGNDIYLKMKELLPVAIENSKRFGKFDFEYPYRGYTDMHVLFEKLGLIVGR